MAKRTAPIHLADPRPDKPRIYNRPWHLDADDRRHHGERKWDVAALEALLEVAAAMESLYPPDFSARNVIRFRAAGGRRPIATLSTAARAALRLTIGKRKYIIRALGDVDRCIEPFKRATTPAPSRRSSPRRG